MPPQTRFTSPINPPEDRLQGKKIWWLVALGFILIALNLYFFFQTYFRKPVVENQNLITQTENWKTYRNEEYGFDMKIPADWRLDVQKDVIHLFYSTKGEQEAKNKENECIKNLVNNDISICANPYIQDFGFLQTNPEMKSYPRNDTEQIEINDRTWNRYESGGFLNYELNLDNKGYTFYSQDEALLFTIISTFKFTK